MIDYRKLADSIEFFEKLGFQRTDQPWWVSKEILDITTPPDVHDIYYLENNRKCLVASGEQSFLYTANKGRLPPGKYQTTTPCFRDESIGILNRKCFMKTELIITDLVTEENLDKLIKQALSFFATQVPDKSLLKVVTTDQGYDINYGEIELGSYGIRECPFLKWIYGTACAEPRLTRAIKMEGKSK